MPSHRQQERNFRSWNPEHTRRAKQYPQNTWDHFWPRIQNLRAQGRKYPDILESIKSDPQAMEQQFHPNLNQLQKQFRERRFEVQQPPADPAPAPNNGDSQPLIHEVESTTTEAMNWDFTVPWGHPLPDAVFPDDEGVLGRNDTPSLTTDLTSDQPIDAETPPPSNVAIPSQNDAQAKVRTVSMDANLLGLTDLNDFPINPETVLSLSSETRVPAVMDYGMSIDANVHMGEDLQLMGSCRGAQVALPSKMSRWKNGMFDDASSNSSDTLFGLSKATQPPHKQPLQLNDVARNFLRLGSSPMRWKLLFRQHPELLDMDPFEYFKAALQSRARESRAEPRNSLACMNVLRASRMLPESRFDDFLAHLELNEQGKANAFQRETAHTFLSANALSLQRLDRQLDATGCVVAPKLCRSSATFLDLPPPVLAERFSATPKVTSNNMDLSAAPPAGISMSGLAWRRLE